MLMNPELRQYSIYLDIVTYLFLYWTKVITNNQKELSELMVIFIIFSNQTISEKFKSSKKKKSLDMTPNSFKLLNCTC